MYLLLNKYAGGGSAEKKWEQIKNSIIQRFDNINVIDLQNHLESENIIN